MSTQFEIDLKRVKTQIQKGTNLEKAGRRGYDNACDYFEILNKTILIQQRALHCLSKCLAHILQRELYSMGNTGLLRREAEITLLQPHLGDTRRQELRKWPFWPSSLFNSQLVKEGEDFLPKKGTLKESQGFAPYQNKPFRGPHNKKRLLQEVPLWGQLLPKHWSMVFLSQGETEQQRLQGSFSTSPQGMRAWKPLPQ